MAEESIFEESEPVQDPILQKRCWITLGALLSIWAVYLIVREVRSIQGMPDRTLAIQYFLFLMDTIETVFVLLAVILFFRKSYWGWTVAAVVVAYRATVLAFASLYFLYKGHFDLGGEMLMFFAASAVALYLIRLPLLRAIYGVRKAGAIRAILFGALVAALNLIIGMIEPYFCYSKP